MAALRGGHLERAEGALESALKVRPGDPDASRAMAQTRIDLALLLFRGQGPDAALQKLDETPETERSGDYYLLRAQLLDAQGKVEEAAAALNQSLRTAPTRVEIYYEAVGFLLKHKLYHEAETFLEQASRKAE